MAKNFVQPGNTITIPAPADVTGGQIVAVGDLIGVAAGDAASGADMDLSVVGVFDLPKVSAEAITIGQPVYATPAGLVTGDADDGGSPTPTAYPRLGWAVAAAANPSPSVAVRLIG